MDTNKIFIDMARRADKFAEMCWCMVKDADPGAWREECRKKQAAGVKFEKIVRGDLIWLSYVGGFENGNKEDYREVPIEQPAIGVISSFNKWDRALTEKEISDLFSGKVRPEDIPQEAPKIKEIGVGIPEAAREVLRQWQKSGLSISVHDLRGSRYTWKFDNGFARSYTIPEQPIPEGMSVEAVEAMWRQGLMLEFDGNFGWDLAADGFDWNGIYRGAQLIARLRIPAQPIPEKLLEGEVEFDISKIANSFCPPKPTIPPHAAERALWKAQRDAGTNEVWQKRPKIGGIDWADIRHDLMFEPGWDPDWDYHVKPMKLTAKIARREVYKTPYDWEFTGTREEYRAECEKYGYVVISEIKEVKTTVKYYFAMLNRYRCTPFGRAASDKDQIIEYAKKHRYTIIGDIEEREIEA